MVARSFIVCGLSLIAAFFIYPTFISALVRYRAGQRVQDYGPVQHQVKSGTPTMGGLLFCTVVAVIYAIFDHSRSGFLSIYALLAGGLLGLLDDLANIRGQGALGLHVFQKLGLQVLIGILIGIGLQMVNQTHEVIPGWGLVDMHWLIIPLASLAIIAVSNSVNLTDGVDGLAAACSLIAFISTWIIAVHLSLRSPALISAALVGSLLAFLIFNWFPARVFMGDTGSLALGCVLVVVTAQLQLIWILPLLGLVFLLESLSVIVNVTAIKRFGKRVFSASPVHHHFEAKGLSEQKVVMFFSFIGVIGALATLLVAFRYGAPS